TKYHKPIIDDMGNECTPEAQAAGTCVFTATARVGVMGTRAYSPSPPQLSYSTGVGDITNLKPPPKIRLFTPRGDGNGGTGAGGFDTVYPGGPNGPVASGAGGSRGPGTGGFDTVYPGGPNGPVASRAGSNGGPGTGGFDTVYPGGPNGPFAP